jgi:ATP-binding cassette subfamily B protein
VVSQDVFLFSGTVAENVSGFDPSPDLPRIEQVLREVGLDRVVQERGGLDARIGERGANLSAGQRQLLALARALYLDRPILILDEATANVDSETEAQLGRAVDRVLVGRTAIVIAHRLSTIRRADRIVVIHQGRLVEEGTHDALLAQGGLYAKLHAIQFAETA